LIDVAILPYYSTLAADENVETVQTIEPSYLILMHFDLGMNDIFVENYASEITECMIINLSYFQAYIFNTG